MINGRILKLRVDETAEFFAVVMKAPNELAKCFGNFDFWSTDDVGMVTNLQLTNHLDLSTLKKRLGPKHRIVLLIEEFLHHLGCIKLYI